MSIYKKMFEVKKEGITLQRNTKAFNYRYATLDQIQEKMNPILESQKLVVIHCVQWWMLVTRIHDIESGESVESSIQITTTKPQDKGSEITYYRRYNLVSLLDLEVSDDDGKKAQDSKPEKKRFNQWSKEWDAAIERKADINTIKKFFKVSKDNEKLYISIINEPVDAIDEDILAAVSKPWTSQRESEST